MYKNIYSQFLILGIAIGTYLFASPGLVLSERFPRACRPEICQSKAKLPRDMRALITSRDGLITSRPRVASKNFSLDQSKPTPNILVPADRKITNACEFVKGLLRCYEVVSFDGCPKTMSFTVTVGGQKFVQKCDLTCTPNTPDPATGLCDCETSNCQTT
jgi:hypothetical protein